MLANDKFFNEKLTVQTTPIPEAQQVSPTVSASAPPTKADNAPEERKRIPKPGGRSYVNEEIEKLNRK